MFVRSRSRFLCSFYMFGSVRFRFGKQNFDWLVLFGSCRTVKHRFGRSLTQGQPVLLSWAGSFLNTPNLILKIARNPAAYQKAVFALRSGSLFSLLFAIIAVPTTDTSLLVFVLSPKLHGNFWHLGTEPTTLWMAD